MTLAASKLCWILLLMALVINGHCNRAQTTVSNYDEVTGATIGTPAPLASPPIARFPQQSSSIAASRQRPSSYSAVSNQNSSVRLAEDEIYFGELNVIHVTLPPLPLRDSQPMGKQIGLPNNPLGGITARAPCSCQKGLCGCCTGMLLQTFRQKGCMNITYIPEDFAFEFKMLMNNNVLYKNKLTGRNPPPVCVTPPRFGFVEVCATFYDVFFVGRNMHVCLEFSGYFQGFELFSREFDCMRIGDQGVKIIKPGEGIGLPQTSSGTQAEIDAGDDDEEYDENVVRRL